MLIIRDMYKKSQKLSFALQQVERKDLIKEIQNLDLNKATPMVQIFPLEPLKKVQRYLVTFSYLVLLIKIRFFSSSQTA